MRNLLRLQRDGGHITQIFNKGEFKERRRKLRRAMTASERRLWIYLRPGLDGYRFRRQFGINSYVVDFYCPRKRLVIEVDGSSHGDPAVREYDAERQKEIECLGIHFLRFTNSEVETDIQSVLLSIRTTMKKLP